jgi:hypothetical protein
LFYNMPSGLVGKGFEKRPAIFRIRRHGCLELTQLRTRSQRFCGSWP